MTIETAIRLAAMWHAGQVDKAGKPYIYHLMRVMNYAPEEYRRAAVFHDVLEDTNETDDTLRMAGVPLGDRLIVSRLTREREGQTYYEYITDIIENGTIGALYVKKADLTDHLNNPNPIPELTARYITAMDRINEEIRERTRPQQGSYS